MSNINDRRLLGCYSQGWLDENLIYKKIKSPIVYNYDLENIAYELGRAHFLLGDDLSHIDLLTNEEILKLIKK